MSKFNSEPMFTEGFGGKVDGAARSGIIEAMGGMLSVKTQLCSRCMGSGHMTNEDALDIYERDGERPNQHFGCVACDGTGQVESAMNSPEPSAPDWRLAMWDLYDYSMRRIDRVECFKRMRSRGLSARQAAEQLHDYEKEG